MTCRLGWHGTVSVNCDAAADVIGVIHRSEQTLLPTDDLVINNEPATGCVGYARLTLVYKGLAAARRHRKNPDSAQVIDHQHHLTIYIHFNMRVPRFPDFRRGAG